MSAAFVSRNIELIKSYYKTQQRRNKPLWANYIAQLITIKKYNQPAKYNISYKNTIQYSQLQRHRTYDFAFITNALNFFGELNQDNLFKLVTDDNQSIQEYSTSILDNNEEHGQDESYMNLYVPLACYRIVHRDIDYNAVVSSQSTPQNKDPCMQAPFSTLYHPKSFVKYEFFSPQYYMQSMYRNFDFTPGGKFPNTVYSPFLLDDAPVPVFEKPPRAPRRQ